MVTFSNIIMIVITYNYYVYKKLRWLQ